MRLAQVVLSVSLRAPLLLALVVMLPLEVAAALTQEVMLSLLAALAALAQVAA